MTVKEKFEAALAERKKQKIEDASRGNFRAEGNSGLPEIPYAPLHMNKQQAFRFVGLPYLVREKPTDSKRVHIAMILGDDDKKFRCVGPDPTEHKDWILYRVMNKVLTKHWDKNIPNATGSLGAYVYDYASTHPELYNRVAKNNNIENNLERGWKFSPYVLFNVIDRANYAWHKENKKYRVLSKKASEYQDKFFFEPGVPDTVFQQIMDNVVAGDGNTNWEDYDIVVQKLDEKPWYKVLHATDMIKYLDADVKDLIVNSGLTNEERSWELNDFDALFPITPYSRIKSKLGLFFQKVDQIFKTKYYEELVALVEKENQERAESQTSLPPNDEVPLNAGTSPDHENAPVNAPQASTVPSLAPTPTPVPTTPVPNAVRSAPTSSAINYVVISDAIWKGLEDGSYNGKKYLGVPKMTPEEKSLVLGVKEDGSFAWSLLAGELLMGASSNFLSPKTVHVDPLDGTVFQ